MRRLTNSKLPEQWLRGRAYTVATPAGMRSPSLKITYFQRKTIINTSSVSGRYNGGWSCLIKHTKKPTMI